VGERQGTDISGLKVFFAVVRVGDGTEEGSEWVRGLDQWHGIHIFGPQRIAKIDCNPVNRQPQFPYKCLEQIPVASVSLISP